MSLHFAKRNHGPNKGKHVAVLSTTVDVETEVDVDVDIDIGELVEDLDDDARKALAEALGMHAVAVDLDEGDPTAEQAYYAFHRGDMETVRRFLCAAAGRIA